MGWPQCVHGGGLQWRLMQMQRPGLAAGVVPRLWWGHRRGTGERLRWLVSVRRLWGESWRGLQDFDGGRAAFTFLTFAGEQASVRHGHSAMWLLLVAPAFLPVSSHVIHQFGQSSLHVSEIGPLQSVENSCGT